MGKAEKYIVGEEEKEDWGRHASRVGGREGREGKGREGGREKGGREGKGREGARKGGKREGGRELEEGRE